jgi:uncharacterized protein YndB with AHSA1/START domain
MTRTAARTDTADAPYALEISRLFDAPPSLVFKVWTTREHLVRWWGPKDFSSTSEKLEFREGGSYRHTIRGPDGHNHGMSGIFREIVEPKRIVFTFAWDDEHGEPADETLVTVTMKPEGQGTRLTFRQEPFADAAARDSHTEGWGEVLDKLGTYLAAGEEAA